MADDNDLIAAIYDAIIDPSRWDEVVKRIVEATKSIAGGISIRGDAAHQMALCNVDPFYTDFYVHTYYKRTPFSPEEARIAPREIRTGTHISLGGSDPIMFPSLPTTGPASVLSVAIIAVTGPAIHAMARRSTYSTRLEYSAMSQHPE